MDQVKLVNRRLQKPLMRLRPALTSRDRWTLSAATLSVIGSIADHRAQLPTREIRAVLSDLAAATLSAELPTGSPALATESAEPQTPSDAGRYEALLRASMLLFNQRGYRETGMEDIAARSVCRLRASTATSPARPTCWPRRSTGLPTGCPAIWPM